MQCPPVEEHRRDGQPAPNPYRDLGALQDRQGEQQAEDHHQVLSSCRVVGESTNGRREGQGRGGDQPGEHEPADRSDQRGVARHLDALGDVGQHDEHEQQDDLADQWPAVAPAAAAASSSEEWTSP